MACGPGSPVGLQENLPRGGKYRQVGSRVCELAGVDQIEREALRSVANPGRKRGGQRQPAKLLDSPGVGGQRSRHADGQRARAAERIDWPTVLQKHVASGCRRSCLAAVDADQPAAGQPDQDEAAPPDPGVVSVHHTQRQAGRHGRIDGIATAGKGVERGLCGERLDRSDKAADSLDRSLLDPVGRPGLDPGSRLGDLGLHHTLCRGVGRHPRRTGQDDSC